MTRDVGSSGRQQLTARPYRLTAGITAIVLGMFAGVWLVLQLRSLLALVAVAGLLAAALDRPVVWVQAHLRLKHRGIAVAIVATATVALVIGAILVVVIPVAGQAHAFRVGLPARVERLKSLPGIGSALRNVDLRGATNRLLTTLPARFGNRNALLGFAQTAVTGLTITATTTVAAIFLLLKGPALAEGAAALIISPVNERRARRVSADLLDAVGGYVRGNLFISFLASLVVVVSLEAMRVPFVGVLAVIMFVVDLLPLVGATLGGLVVTAATFVLDPHPWKAVAFVAIFVVYQQVESHTLYPVVMGRTVKIGAIAVFFVTLAGVELGGILGALIAIPAGAAISIGATELLAERRARLSTDQPVRRHTRELADGPIG